MTPALLALAIAVTAPAAKEKAKPDTDIVGEWVCERSTFAGNPRPPAKDPLHYVFAADGTYTVRRGDRDLAGRRVYGTDPAKAPAEIDMRLEPDQPDGRTYLGIYRVE